MAACIRQASGLSTRYCPRLLRKIHIQANVNNFRNISTFRLLTGNAAHKIPTHHKNSYLVCASIGARFKSSKVEPSSTEYIPEAPPIPESSTISGYIPDVPSIPEVQNIADIVQPLNALGEPTLQSLGLGSFWPSGMIQMGLDQLHCLGLPWWGAIIAGTVCLRLLVFPLVIVSQKNTANMNNHMPTITRLQDKFTKSRMSGNPMEAAKAGQELMEYMERNKVQPMKNMMVPLAQMPVFISVFLGLRQMANLPIESMQAGGLFWFTDLTVPDPFYLLPVFTMATFLCTIELGVDGMKAGNQSHMLKYVMRAMPFVMFPFIMNFPTALCMYWFTSNAFSLVQVMCLRIPKVRTFFDIPEIVKHEKSAVPKKKFIQGFKENWKNSKLAAEMEDRQRLDSLRFRDAGSGPLQKTYSYDPTKVKQKERARAK